MSETTRKTFGVLRMKPKIPRAEIKRDSEERDAVR